MALLVKKFGGSLLKTVSDFDTIADYLSHFYQQGHKLIVVVSAPAGLTNSLIAEVHTHKFSSNNKAFDLLLALGEQKSCAFLGLALEKRQIPFSIFAGPQVGIRKTASGHWQVDTQGYKDAIPKGIVIVSGFQALNEANQLFVFERGGSDLTALILAHQLKADLCELYKDVGGIFNVDPKKDASANPFCSISFNSLAPLLQQDAPIVQQQALEYAKTYQQCFWVKNLDNQGTFVGDFDTERKKFSI